MGLDKTGFTLLDKEFSERRRTINEAYQNKKSEALAEQIKNLFSVGEQRKKDIANIERNYHQTHFEKEVTLNVKAQEREVFSDFGGSRDDALKVMNTYEKELKEKELNEKEAKKKQSQTPNSNSAKPETEAEFKDRMTQHFNENRGRGKSRGRD